MVRGSKELSLTVSGHAGAAPHGEDLVCAAVSALVETLALGLERFDVPGTWTLKPGMFTYQGAPGTFGVALETILAGLSDLATSHKAYVRYQERSTET